MSRLRTVLILLIISSLPLLLTRCGGSVSANAKSTVAAITSELPLAVVGNTYTVTLQAIGGVPPYTWSLVAGQLPAGLTLSGATISGTPQQPGTSSFTLQIKDASGQPASVSLQLVVDSSLNIVTSTVPDGTIGRPYSTQLTASGGIPPYTWQIASGVLPTGLTLSSSGLLSGIPSAQAETTVDIQVTDSAPAQTAANGGGSFGSNSKSKGIKVRTYKPLAITTASMPPATVGSVYSQTLQATGGLTPYVWSITSGQLPPGLALNASTATISGTPSASGKFYFTAGVSDSASPASSATEPLTLSSNSTPNQLTVTTASLASATAGVSYTATLQAAGGVPPYTWSISGGSLPAGLTLDAATGVISGTPLQSSTSSATFAVKDSAAATASAALALSVSPAATLQITTTSLPSGEVSSSYYTVLAATGGITPYQWYVSSGSLPPGLTLDPNSGAIYGTPSGAGDFSIGLGVQDSVGATATANLSLKIAAVTLAIVTTALPDGSVGVPYEAMLSAYGGTPPYTWSITSGTLPPSIALAASTGEINGTPSTDGTFNLIWQVQDSARQTATKAIPITVGAAIAVDQYGGRTDISCSSNLGKWHTEKIGDRWWICNPLNHGFFFQAPLYVQPPSSLAKYGGSSQAWATATVHRLKAWNFTGIGNIAYNVVYPTNSPGVNFPFVVTLYTVGYAQSHGQVQSSTSMGGPTSTPINYNVKNLCRGRSVIISGWCPTFPDLADSGLADYADAFFKSYDMKTYAASPFFMGAYIEDSDAVQEFGGGDQCDANGNNCANLDGWSSIAYLTLTGQPVQTGGCTGALFGGVPGACPQAPDRSWFVSFDPEVKSKIMLADTLKAKYGTIAALNTAWGSTYAACNLGRVSADGFGSCGTQYTGETLATADGRTTAYPSHTITHLTPSRGSVQILVNGTPLVGDVRTTADNPVTTGQFYGTYVTASISYATGMITGLTFSTTPTASQDRGIERVSTNGSTVTVRTVLQHGLWTGAKVNVSGTTSYNVTGATITVLDAYDFAYTKSGSFAAEHTGNYASVQVPQAGDLITVNYIQNGYAVGNGLLDEDGRASHTWLGSSNGYNLAPVGTNPTYHTTIINDFDAIDHDLTYAYLNAVKQKYTAALPNQLYLGPDGISRDGWPARRGILKAAGETLDVMQTAYGPQITQAGLDYIYGSYGDHPMIDTLYPQVSGDGGPCANGNTAVSVTYATHALLGAAYDDRVNSALNSAYTADGSHPWVGMMYWSYIDKPGRDGCGLVSAKDNAYDGFEDVSPAVTCSNPLDGSVVGPYTCGGESGNYTDAISKVKQGNTRWRAVQ